MSLSETLFTVLDRPTTALKTMLLELRPSSQIAGDIVSKVVDGCTKQLDLVRTALS